MKITPLKFTREIPAIPRYGYAVCAVCQNPIPYLNPCYPFWKHRGYHRTHAEPYSKGYEPDTLASTNPLNHAKIDIVLVNAVTYQRACQLPGSQSFSITLSNGETLACSALALAEKLIDLTGIPKKYHDFADVFSEVKANKLLPHRPYDLKINIEEGSTPPLGPIYSLSKTELEALREFLDKNIANGFIRPTRSPYGAPILFVKKKGGALRLCVDLRGLN